MSVEIELHRSGNNLNVMVGAQSDTDPAIILWILLKQGGGERFFYPSDFSVGGAYVYPGLYQSKIDTEIGSGPVEVIVYAVNANEMTIATA